MSYQGSRLLEFVADSVGVRLDQVKFFNFIVFTF